MATEAKRFFSESLSAHQWFTRMGNSLQPQYGRIPVFDRNRHGVAGDRRVVGCQRQIAHALKRCRQRNFHRVRLARRVHPRGHPAAADRPAG